MSPIPSPPEDDVEDATPTRVFGVCLVGFDHALGPTVEFCHPETLNDNHQLLAEHLPFFALPDGAHARDEDYTYFHLYLPSVSPSTIFGISCNRQIQSDELINKGKDVTRSTVQKAIVVLASKPIFGPLRDKLGVITRAFFAQKDFDDKSILVDLYASLETREDGSGGLSDALSRGEAGGMYMGTSLRELVYKFRFKTLMLLKLLMLQRRVMFYAAHTPVEQLCTFQYSLVALVPALLMHLEDAATPSLNARVNTIVQPSSLRTSDKQSLIRYLGLPLNIFGKGSFFQPYLPLQQIDMLKTKSYLVGTTNSIFQQQRDCQIDVIVNIETAAVEILNPKLTTWLTLTAADRKWMDEIVTTVDNSYNAADPSRPIGLAFIGSDDFLRAKFEEYICSLLACIKLTDYLAGDRSKDVLLLGSDLDSKLMPSFNESFVKAFKATPAFELWNRNTDEVIFDLVEPKHPMEGKTNPIEDVGIRLAHGLHDLHLEENLGPTREAISRGITSGSDSLWKTYSSLRSDIGRRQSELRERREKEGGGPIDLALAPQFVGNTVLAGVDVARTGATAVVSGLGGLFTSSKKSLWRSTTPEGSSSPTSEGGPRSGSDDRSRTSSGTYPPTSSASAEASATSTPTFSSFFRPLSNTSLASVGSAGRTPTPPTTSQGGGGFFGALKRNFSDPSPPGGSPVRGARGMDDEEEELVPRDLDAEMVPRDLDAELATAAHGREQQGGKRNSAAESGFEHVEVDDEATEEIKL
ncbi:late secretory pathway protein AVL9 family protein [Pseudohyphozyma bogoriensis]|nr:late secretory pathway protein AVL9 family protein [Pseudohyphozyma bogoriensis]